MTNNKESMIGLTQRPLVSVIIPSFGQGKYLREALDSVLKQSYTHYEVIVIDDASGTDDIKNICAEFKELQYIRHAVNSGVSSARNAGMRQAKGDYIAFLDDDDIWISSKLESQVTTFLNELKNGRKLGLLYTGLFFINSAGTVTEKNLYRANGWHWKHLAFVDFIGTPSSVMISRNVLDEVGFFDESLRNSQDWDYWVRIARKFEILSVNDFLCCYRDIPGSLSKNIQKINKTFEVYRHNQEGLTSNEAEKLKAYAKRVIAHRYKNAAYLALEEGSLELFQKYMKEAENYYPGISTWKTRLYGVLARIMKGLVCRFLKQRRKKLVVFIQNINDDYIDSRKY